MTPELRVILVTQREAADRLEKTGQIMPWVFFRIVSDSDLAKASQALADFANGQKPLAQPGRCTPRSG